MTAAPVFSICWPQIKSKNVNKRDKYCAMNINAEYYKPDDTIPLFNQWFGSWEISVNRRAFGSAQLKQFYDRAAPDWCATLDRLGVPNAYEHLLENVFTHERTFERTQRPRVLDCGAGTGAFSSALVNVMGAPIALDAIDTSRQMLDRCGQNLKGLDCPVVLRQADVCSLPYEDNLFDIVLGAHILEHLPDPSRALNEMVRVLKPGGILIACVTRQSLVGMMIRLKWRTHGVTPERAKHWLECSGLENTRCYRLGERLLPRQLSVACIGHKPY